MHFMIDYLQMRLLYSCERIFTERHRDMMNDLYNLSVSRYREVRHFIPGFVYFLDFMVIAMSLKNNIPGHCYSLTGGLYTHIFHSSL